MKKMSNYLLLFIIASFVMGQTACIKDQCKRINSDISFQPVYKTAASVRANIKSHAPRPVRFPGKMCIAGGFVYLNEVNKGIHVIDNRNPAAPVKLGFIELPGNVDIAIRDNVLFADFYSNLVAIDISNPLDVKLSKILEKVFPRRYYPGMLADSTLIITDWVKKTTSYTFDCDDPSYGPIIFEGMLANSTDAGLRSGSGAAGAPIGISGSLSRFAIIENYLYALNSDSLHITGIATAAQPVPLPSAFVDFGMETLYPFKGKLFMGANAGMFIYSVQNPLVPVKLGSFAHVRSCDPVIADETHAYVTLHSGTLCQGFANQVDVIDISNLADPKLLKSFALSSPRGLSKGGKLLFVCDNDEGIKVFDAAQPSNLSLLKTIPARGASEVIAYNNVALCVTKEAIIQYDYSDAQNIRLLSTIPIEHD